VCHWRLSSGSKWRGKGFSVMMGFGGFEEIQVRTGYAPSFLEEKKIKGKI